MTVEASLTVAWGLNGLRAVRGRPVCVIVDVLSFSSAVVAGCAAGAVIFPCRWRDGRAAALAASVGAELAMQRQDQSATAPADVPTLSPPSLARLPAGYRLVLPSPNGSTLAVAAEADQVVAGCLRNASAVARWLQSQALDVVVVAAGERWPDGSLRVALEDLLGAGAIVAGWPGSKCVEALAAEAAFRRFADDLPGALLATASGRELVGRGYRADVEFAARLDADAVVPLLRDGAFQAWPGDPPG